MIRGGQLPAWWVVLALLIVSPPPALSAADAENPEAAATTRQSSCSDASGTGWRRFGCDSAALARRFSLRDPDDARRAAIVIGAGAALYTVRDEIRREIQQRHDPDRTDLYEKARWSARGAASPIVAGLLYAARGLTGNRAHSETAQIVLESTLYSSLAAGAGSIVLGAERPEDGDAVHAFDPDGHGVSLDTAISASIAAPLDRRLLRARAGDGRGVRVLKWTGRGLLYATVGLTAMQRMDDDKHWAPDVFFGAAMGLSVGYSLCSAHEPAAPPAGDTASRVLPAAAVRVTGRRPMIAFAGDGVALRWVF